MISKIADKLPNMHNTTFQGLPIVIEWPKGSTRVGKRPDGTPYKTEMQADYGYVPHTEAAGDAEDLDVYIGPDENAKYVYAIEQLNEDGEFDEWKMMLGFPSLEDAEAMYLAHYEEGWEEDRVGDIEEILFDHLFDMVERNQEEVAEKTAANQPDLFHPIDYSVVHTTTTIAVFAKLRGKTRAEDIVFGEVYLGFTGKGRETAAIYDKKIFTKGLLKRNIHPEQVWQEMYKTLVESAQKAGVKFVKDNMDGYPYWRGAGGSIIKQTDKEVKVKIAGEQLIEALSTPKIDSKGQWASYMKARLAFTKVHKADDLDDRLKAVFMKDQPATSATKGPDDSFWFSALDQIGHGRKFDVLTKDEQSQVIALAQKLKGDAVNPNPKL